MHDAYSSWVSILIKWIYHGIGGTNLVKILKRREPEKFEYNRFCFSESLYEKVQPTLISVSCADLENCVRGGVGMSPLCTYPENSGVGGF